MDVSGCARHGKSPQQPREGEGALQLAPWSLLALKWAFLGGSRGGGGVLTPFQSSTRVFLIGVAWVTCLHPGCREAGTSELPT